ncbi:hypothetical protein IAG41_21325 [Sphingomonas sp. JC676]|uniref:hypothetical protein n=1 Tax=Sphingomonas sp. JC676 TaxID=2768065 RepID=UPI0016579A9F|nr:hypothetical protein [Sphingomonas sp. JC676]MBC9034941.1 hypothetical protein [Sphingomonas sp. JC676]
MSLRFSAAFFRHAVAAQIACVVGAMLFAALYPPARGKMILIPIWPGAERGMLALAIDEHALLIGQGPLSNSFVVFGERSAIAAGMLRRGVLVLAAPPAACGERGRLA